MNTANPFVRTGVGENGGCGAAPRRDAADELIRATTRLNEAVREARAAGWSVEVATMAPEGWECSPGDVAIYVAINRTHF